MTEITAFGANGIVSPHLTAWEWQVALYIFLGGTAAGLMAVAALVALWGGRERQRVLYRAAILTALPALCAGLFLLWIDLGDRLNFYQLMLHFQPTSAISWGTWIILVAMVLLVVEAWSEVMIWENAPRIVAAAQRLLGWTKPVLALVERTGRLLPATTLAVELCLATYTGLLLSSLTARPLWSGLWVPALFVASALACGAAFASWLATGEAQRWLRWAAGALAAMQVVLALAYMAGLQAVSPASAQLLLQSWFGPAFWGGFVVIGSMGGGAISAWSARGRGAGRLLGAATLALMLAGSLALRLAIVYAGQISHL